MISGSSAVMLFSENSLDNPYMDYRMFSILTSEYIVLTYQMGRSRTFFVVTLVVLIF